MSKFRTAHAGMSMLLLGAAAAAPLGAQTRAGQAQSSIADRGRTVRGRNDAPANEFGRFAARTHGSAAAPVTVYEFSDFQCPYCRQFATETYPYLDSLYVKTGRVRWVFVNRPKVEKHPNAPLAAEAALCAAQQRKFWAFHDALFATQDTWAGMPHPNVYFIGLADSAGVNRQALSSCLARDDVRALLDADMQDGMTLNIGGVPSFVVDGKLVAQGALPREMFVHTIDSLLATHQQR